MTAFLTIVSANNKDRSYDWLYFGWIEAESLNDAREQLTTLYPEASGIRIQPMPTNPCTEVMEVNASWFHHERKKR